MVPPRCFSCGGCASDAVRDAPSPRRPQTPRRSPAVAFLFGSAPFLTVLTRTASRRLWCGWAGRSQGTAGASALGTGPPGGSACAPWVSGHPRRGRREQRPGAAELTSRAAVPTVCGSRDRRSYENPVPEGPRRGAGTGAADTRGGAPLLAARPLLRDRSTAGVADPGARTCSSVFRLSWFQKLVEAGRLHALCAHLSTMALPGHPSPPGSGDTVVSTPRETDPPRSAPQSCCGGSDGCLEGTASAGQPPMLPGPPRSPAPGAAALPPALELRRARVALRSWPHSGRR